MSVRCALENFILIFYFFSLYKHTYICTLIYLFNFFSIFFFLIFTLYFEFLLQFCFSFVSAVCRQLLMQPTQRNFSPLHSPVCCLLKNETFAIATNRRADSQSALYSRICVLVVVGRQLVVVSVVNDGHHLCTATALATDR